ncbi:MAG: Ni/Fe hydrogenase subunit alpha [Chloroflexi bacterium]|uniref:Ni/Fe hydrogenase subunit alpha n=1 Tax=Candidatus Chlorohelix allophototropha TaxID=3003348 RepID=A0A8T7LTY9_9CHLR|nr:Ni/Fe hydrogenase subunit alpha [Chloroflexota bacterium]WJW66201.1 Ni/Fe hydrogenase subunit alpha [Chloroflexota bacterium L227-S17]
MNQTRTIKVENIARIEGEGKLLIKVRHGEVEAVHLDIFEPPRFFEAFLKGRHYKEVPDMVSRICGICPVAHQMSSIHALEQILGVTIDPQVRALRRVLYLGEWLESHALHVHMLHAPDFVGTTDVIQMTKTYPEEVQRGIKLKKLGHEIMTVLGGRAVHPINVRVGGFYKSPKKADLADLIERLKWGREAALDTIRWVSTLPFPEYEQDYEFVSLRHPDEYPVNEGRLISSRGLDIPVSDYEKHFVEEQVANSNALHSRVKERGAYLVGPLARFNLNFDKLAPIAQQAAQEAGLNGTCNNPFKSIIVRSIESLHICEESLSLLGNYEEPDKAAVATEPRAGKGYSCTEAPRGLLYHYYELDEQGLVKEAQIIPPTAQNQNKIEEDLFRFVSDNLEMPKAQMTAKCEQTIRNYDPCLSCATHFLKLEFDEE